MLLALLFWTPLFGSAWFRSCGIAAVSAEGLQLGSDHGAEKWTKYQAKVKYRRGCPGTTGGGESPLSTRWERARVRARVRGNRSPPLGGD